MPTKKLAQTDSYEVRVVCDNCDYEGMLSLPKGTPVASNMLCPNCGCNYANKRNRSDRLVLQDYLGGTQNERRPKISDPWTAPPFGPIPKEQELPYIKPAWMKQDWATAKKNPFLKQE